jgi:hypothetical protein
MVEFLTPVKNVTQPHNPPSQSLTCSGFAIGPCSTRSGSLGLCVHVKDGLFVGVHVYFRKPKYKPYTGKILSLGSTLLTCPSTPEEAIECFGQPLDTEDDGDDGFSFEYNYKDNWFELQFNRDQLLESISVI